MRAGDESRAFNLPTGSEVLPIMHSSSSAAVAGIIRSAPIDVADISSPGRRIRRQDSKEPPKIDARFDQARGHQARARFPETLCVLVLQLG